MRARFVYRSSLAVQIFCGILNCYAAFRVILLSRSPVDYRVNVVQTSFPTNSVSFSHTSLSTPTNIFRFSGNLVSSQSVSSPSTNSVYSIRSWTLPFSVYVDRGCTFVRISGKDYAVGDRHAYGVVSDIFPERVYFANGSYIDNQPQIERVIRNEQRTDDNTLY